MAEKKSILIIEDEPDLAEILSEIAKKEFPDSNIEITNNGTEGFRIIGLRRYDLLITDMKVPGLSSSSLLDSIAALSTSMVPGAVIVFSGHEDLAKLKGEAPRNLKIKFVSKPCPMKELAYLIRESQF